MNDATAPEAIHAVIAGIEVVTIPVAHYAELLDCQRRLAAQIPTSPRVPARVRVDSRSRLFDDPEVTNFLEEIKGTMRLHEAHTVCVERFGASRAPSRATIGRFWQSRRGER